LFRCHTRYKPAIFNLNRIQDDIYYQSVYLVNGRDTMPTRRNNKIYHSPVEATVDVLGGKWKPLILWALRNGTLRFSQIEEELSAVTPNITQRMLTRQLRELESDGLVVRKVYPEVPPRVEYTLTERYHSLIPIVDLLCAWGKKYMADQIDYDVSQCNCSLDAINRHDRSEIT